MNEADALELIKIIGLTLLGISLLIGFGVAVGTL